MAHPKGDQFWSPCCSTGPWCQYGVPRANQGLIGLSIPWHTVKLKQITVFTFVLWIALAVIFLIWRSVRSDHGLSFYSLDYWFVISRRLSFKWWSSAQIEPYEDWWYLSPWDSLVLQVLPLRERKRWCTLRGRFVCMIIMLWAQRRWLVMWRSLSLSLLQDPHSLYAKMYFDQRLSKTEVKSLTDIVSFKKSMVGNVVMYDIGLCGPVKFVYKKCKSSEWIVRNERTARQQVLKGKTGKPHQRHKWICDTSETSELHRISSCLPLPPNSPNGNKYQSTFASVS